VGVAGWVIVNNFKKVSKKFKESIGYNLIEPQFILEKMHSGKCVCEKLV